MLKQSFFRLVPRLKPMGKNPLTLSFKKEQEKEFLNDYYPSSLELLRYSFLLGIISVAGFIALDNAVLPEIKSQLFKIRFFIVLSTLVLVLILSFLKSFEKYWQLATFTAIMISGISAIMILPIIPPESDITYYEAIICLVFF